MRRNACKCPCHTLGIWFAIRSLSPTSCHASTLLLHGGFSDVGGFGLFERLDGGIGDVQGFWIPRAIHGIGIDGIVTFYPLPRLNWTILDGNSSIVPRPCLVWGLFWLVFSRPWSVRDIRPDQSLTECHPDSLRIPTWRTSEILQWFQSRQIYSCKRSFAAGNLDGLTVI